MWGIFHKILSILKNIVSKQCYAHPSEGEIIKKLFTILKYEKERKEKECQYYFTRTCDVHSPPLVYANMDYRTKYVASLFVQILYIIHYFHRFVLQ